MNKSLHLIYKVKINIKNMANKPENNNLERISSLLEKFSNAHGVSGYEDNIRKLFSEEIKPFVDEIKIDKMGNLIGHKKGKGLSIMIVAHMDEIGMMVKYIDDKGFLFFSQIGGYLDQTLLSQRVLIHGKNGLVTGLIGAKPIHAMTAEERKKLIEAKAMFIDIGAKNAEDAKKMGVEIGSLVTMDRKFRRLANNMVTGKAFDDRSGLVMIIEAIRRVSEIKANANVFVVGTVQEEVGLKGARTSAYEINPDLAIATDLALTGDHPGTNKQDSAVEIGKGPAITIMDANGRGMIVADKVVKWLKETAEKNKIECQFDVSEGGTTDAAAIQLTQSGILAGVVSTPARYIHTPIEMLNVADLDKGSELIARAIVSADKYFSAKK